MMHGPTNIKTERKFAVRCVHKIAKSDYNFDISVRLSAWNNSAPTERIFVNFDIRVFFENLSTKKIQASLKSDRN